MLILDQRVAPRLPLEFYLNQRYDEREHVGQAVELSANGLSFDTPRLTAPPPGRHAWLDFRLPRSEILIRALVEVVHSRARDEYLDRVGVRFKHLFPDQRELLHGYLAGTATN